jgi:acyl carrier protein
MEINHFIQNFAAQFDDSDAEEFKPETKFRDLEEWSSLRALSIIAMTDEEYNVVLRGEDIRNSQTIQDLYTIINSRIEIEK